MKLNFTGLFFVLFPELLVTLLWSLHNYGMDNRKKQLGSFCMVASGVFLSTMDSSMMNIALPYIMRSLSCSLAQVEWVILIYLLTITSSLLLCGRYSDKCGKVRFYIVGLSIFAVACLLSFYAWRIELLILSRMIQGVGAAMMMATGPAIIRMSVPRTQIGKWIGLLGIFTSMGLMSGPLIGGLVLHSFNWRTLFLVNLPISLPAIVFGILVVGKTDEQSITTMENIDGKGTILWIVLISLTVLLLNHHSSFTPFTAVITIIILLFSSILFYHQQVNLDGTLLPLALLRKRFYSIAMACSALSFCVLFFVLILMPFYLKIILELPFDRIGFIMMAVPVSLFIVSPLSGRLYDRYGAKYLTSFGLFITSCAILSLAQLSPASTSLEICSRLALLGCGQSIFLAPNTASVLSRVNFEQTGITSGMLATSRNLGMLLGAATAGFLFSVIFRILSEGVPLKDYNETLLPAFMGGFSYTLMSGALIGLGTALLSLKRD